MDMMLIVVLRHGESRVIVYFCRVTLFFKNVILGNAG